MSWLQPRLWSIGCLLLALWGSGCSPASRSPLDEEKEPHFVMGMNRLRAMDDNGAIEAFQRALEVNPRSSAAHFRLGTLYLKDNRDPAAAIYHFQRYLQLRPGSEYASVVRQHIIGCKQELARSVALAPVSGEMQKEMEKLVEKIRRLEDENLRLTQQNRQLQDQLATLQGVRPTPPPPIELTSSPNRTQPAPSTPPASITSPRTHTVQAGDTFYSIARRYGLNPSALQAANPGVDPTRLRIGQKIALPSH